MRVQNILRFVSLNLKMKKYLQITSLKELCVLGACLRTTQCQSSNNKALRNIINLRKVHRNWHKNFFLDSLLKWLLINLMMKNSVSLKKNQEINNRRTLNSNLRKDYPISKKDLIIMKQSKWLVIEIRNTIKVKYKKMKVCMQKQRRYSKTCRHQSKHWEVKLKWSSSKKNVLERSIIFKRIIRHFHKIQILNNNQNKKNFRIMDYHK